MRIRSVTVRRMPGIETPFTIPADDGGLTLLTGPNGSGKTTLCRAVRALLWSEPDGPSPLHVEARLDIGGRAMHAEREGHAETRWSESGEPGVEPGAEPQARPALPPPQMAACYTLGLFDIVAREGESTDRAIAAEILRQTRGGYDLDLVLEEVARVAPRAGQKEKQELAELDRELGRLKGERSDLAAREDALEEKRERLRRARAAGRQLELLRQRRAVLEAARACDAARAEYEQFPPALAAMTGTERETLDELTDRIERTRRELDECDAAIAAAEETIEIAAVPEGAVAPTELATWKTRAAALATRETELRNAALEEARAEAELAEAGLELDPGWDPERAPRFDVAAIDEAAAHLKRTAACEVEIEALSSVLAHEDLRAGPAPAPAEPRPLERGIEALEDWLADGGRSPGGRGAAILVALGLLAGAAVAVFVALEVTPLGWIPAGVIALSAVWLLQRSAVRGAARARLDEERRARFLATGLVPPSTWEPTAVAGRLRALLDELARARIDALRAHFRRRFEAARCERERARNEDLPRERERLRERIGLVPGAGALEIAEFARRVHAYRLARQKLEASRAGREHLAENRDRELAALNEFTTRFRYAPAADAAESTHHLEDLDRRSRDAAAARETIAREKQHRDRLEKQQAELDGKRRAVFEALQLAPDDETGLAELLRLRPRFLEARDALQNAGANLALRRQDLASNPLGAEFPDVDALNDPELAERIAALEVASAGADDLAKEIGGIERDVEHARASSAFEDASARRQAALEALLEVRDEAMLREAGRLLVEAARDRHEQVSRPEVLERARALFERFTSGAYQLEFGSGTAGPALRAVETSRDRNLGLAQLSDGTRAQLLLAARVAFAFENERGVKPPLFLDETLSTSDPERFHAIAASLAELMRTEGRQVFYLTSNPADGAFWNRALEAAGLPAARPFDLGTRRRADAAASADMLAAVPPPEAPSPAGLTAAEYGARLGVARFDPWQEAAEIPLFYLLRDDLALLHRLVQNRIETVAAWRTYRVRLRAEGRIDEAGARRLEARIEATAAFLSAWRIGRARPVHREVLEESGAVTDKFIDDVAALARRLHGDGKALVAQLLEHEIRGFQQRQAEKLAEYLEQQGHLDRRDPLDPEAIRRQVAEALGSGASAALPLAELSALVDVLWQLAGPEQ
ncbi:MAG: AAA family ATPase [Planctomycetes bacterium]|nr:AAA family ATPase [Planctomycetota bacterium]